MELLALALGLLEPVVGLRARARGDLLGGLVRALEDVAGLLADLVEGMPDGRLGRGRHLELGDQAAHPLHVAVHGGAVVAAQRHRELDRARVLENPVAIGRGQHATGSEPPPLALLVPGVRADELGGLALDLG